MVEGRSDLSCEQSQASRTLILVHPSMRRTWKRFQMAKKRNTSKPRQPQTRPLEDLLNSGQSTFYGQVCWSIANRGTKRPREGQLVDLNGVDRGVFGEAVSWRLTNTSVENIERCIGLRTCGEAVALFEEAVKTEPASSGECPLGHGEQAMAYMMYGEEPTEPCPRCGEIPKFSDAGMSLNFEQDGPVKGVDGEEYSLCPECGEDTLELQGPGIAEWGWKIVCFSCDWEIKHAERLDITQYCGLMEEVRSRLDSINRLMELPGITVRDRLESVSLQLRMVLELIVFGSLVANKDVWRRSKKELRSSHDIGRKLRELGRLHPNFYPVPLEPRASHRGQEPGARTDGFLSKDKLIKVYGALGNILHAENPLGKEKDHRYYLDAIPGWVAEVVNLLECHKVHLYHRTEEFYWIKMFGDVDGELTWVRFKTDAAGETKCSWPDCVSSNARLYCEYIQRPWRQCGLQELEPQQTSSKTMADLFEGTADG